MKFIFTLLLIYSSCFLQAQISGLVEDDHGHTLPGATIFLLPDSLQIATDDKGEFSFDINASKTYELRTSYIGYETDTLLIDLRQGKARNIRIVLYHDHEMLGTIEVTEEHAKQETTLHADHIHQDFFQKNLEGSFAQSIDKLPGISAINVGVGIAKPVIRGLSSNRIIVNHQGIKQESQQWGSDHGLEIDQFDAERVEIIKGPGSLQYGSDGLGGVINIMPEKILPENSFKGSVLGLYKTNNDHFGGSAKLGFNVKNWFLSARYSLQDFADYQVPADQFNYNDFVLPIYNNRLKNTAGKESNISITAGMKKDWGITRLLYSHYSLDAGLFSGAVGVPRSYALTEDGNYRDLDVPKQQVDHYKLYLNQLFFFGNNHLAIDVGLQRNLRQEFSEPEFHSIPLSQLEDPNDKLAIELLLETFSVASHYQFQINPTLKNIIGLNAQWQANEHDGFEYLLPNFTTFRSGMFSILEKEISKRFFLTGGLRADLGHNETEFNRQFVWDSNENIIDSLLSPTTDDRFFNWSASIGTNYTWMDEKWVFKANLGKSFRLPYPSETVSNGIHHGTFRHEVGTADLESEHGYQLDLSANLNTGKFKANVAYYFNYFDNYIYLGPTFPAKFSSLPEAGQIFQYRQDDAIYSGFEIEWDLELTKMIGVEQAIEFVQSYNPSTRLALPFTPQPSIRTELQFEPGIEKWIDDSYLELTHQYYFAAASGLRVDRSEQATPAYHLVNLGVGSDFRLGEQKLEVKFQVQNLMNTRYFAHLSRYRIINVPEQGRNFVLILKVPISGKL